VDQMMFKLGVSQRTIQQNDTTLDVSSPNSLNHRITSRD
jgi:hypothetical protein